MKFLSLLRDGRSAIGVLADEHTVVDLSVAAPELPRGMCRFLAAGEEAMEAARRAVDSGAGRAALADQTLLAPVPRPRKFLAIGLNYADHAAETGQKPAVVPDGLQQAGHLHQSAGRRDPHSAGLLGGRLRGRVRLRHRSPLPRRRRS